MTIIIGLADCKEIRYPNRSPFSPDVLFPELDFLPRDSIKSEEVNPVYAAVRHSMYLAGWDVQNYGTREWNPLSVFIQPSRNILIKPNFVLHEYSPSVKDCVTTHGSVIRAVLDYAYLAGGPSCHITIADAPEQAADFNKILEQTGILEILAFYKERFDFQINVFDLRKVASLWDGETGFLPPALQLTGDPLGYVPINLGTKSELEKITQSSTQFGIANYGLESLKDHHYPGHHEYLISRTILNADTIISLPKMKTHQKTGLTGALKNFVGINGSKDWLPHYREGSAQQGGDEYPSGHWIIGVNRDMKKKLQRKNQMVWHLAHTVWQVIRPLIKKKSQFHSGAWYGNDTIWRMIIDLNKIVMFANQDGRLSEQPQRNICFIVDGVIAGQGDGPLSPIAKEVGIILAATDVVAIDVVMARIMGYDWHKIPLLSNFLIQTSTQRLTQIDKDEIKVITDDGNIPLEELEPMNFIPPPGWIGNIEI